MSKKRDRHTKTQVDRSNTKENPNKGETNALNRHSQRFKAKIGICSGAKKEVIQIFHPLNWEHSRTKTGASILVSTQGMARQ